MRKILSLLVSLSLAACVSPYEGPLTVALSNCNAGEASACQNAGALREQDAAWHQRQNEEVGNAILGILAVGVAGVAVAAAASTPQPAYAGTATFCTSNAFGNTVNTYCY